MATKKGSADGEAAPAPPGPSPTNPFILVPHAVADLQNYEAGGGGTTELVPVTQAVREELAGTLRETRASLAATLQSYPNLLSTVVLRLRETGIAKSHRPLNLIERAGLESAGHAHLDEMLVGSSAAGLQQLEQVIYEGSTQVLRANISAIARIEPWTRQKRNPEGSLALRQNGSALLRLFRYWNDEATATTRANVLALLELLDVKFHVLQGIGSGLLLKLEDLDHVDDPVLDLILDHPGIRTASTEPLVLTAATGAPAAVATVAGLPFFGVPSAGLPTVSVFDSGTAAGNAALAPWISSRGSYVLPPETDHVHGTAVASLVAGGKALNPTFACPPCVVHDIAAMETAGSPLAVLAERLRDAVALRPDIKVWNLSLGVNAPCDPDLFGELAQVLDTLSDRHGVLFVVAAGNYLSAPRRTWPPDKTMTADRLSTPGDSVRALTVGSISHADSADTLSLAGEPAPYSRRGPGPVFTPKPDIVHHGGNVHTPWTGGQSSTRVLAPDGATYASFGTSFAAPLASAMAAHVWQSLEGHPALQANPALVKALMIHAGQLSGPAYQGWERRYFGAGLPLDAMSVLFDRDDSFTMVFEASLIPGAWRWRKSNYPIPAALRHHGKLRAEVIMTAAYTPPLNPSFGAEYVRANLELGFGVEDADGFKGKVPLLGEEGTTGYESEQVEYGGKWAPVKVHRRKFPQGVAGDVWALNAKLMLRAFEPPLQEALRAYIVVTLRATDGDTRVHAQGIHALQARNWVQHALPLRVPIVV
ncbi:MAG: S8 family peptidase [Polaromonas sp.]|uniref:S8 family anti-phage peptidase IteS n=1 Tax=Polaromonas sp. TaxID=1869339 RepID=UPI0025FF8E6A|nr:S8 family anti-phage peptidase IteS [Polaromonas sp.]MBI2728448.1 S8 family peptidase [Polaromonas sp.]